MNLLRFYSLSVFFIMLAGTPIQGQARDIFFSPLFSYESQGEDYSIKGIGPFLDVSQTHDALRPLYYRDTHQDTTYFLYPLGKRTPEHSYFIPFMRSTEDESHSHFDIFPYFSGTYEDRTYRGIFPLYGHMYHRYGWDEASFFLWPLYSKTERFGEETYSFLWPIFSYKKNSLTKIFPLYGWEKTTDSEYFFFLWPFFHYERGSSGSMVAALPLFRYEHGPTHWNASFLWPFFTYNRDDASNHSSADFPWPLIRTASGGYEETRIFPFYLKKEEGPSYRIRSVLWPLWTERSSSTGKPGNEEQVTSVLILNRLTERSAPDGTRSRSFTLWPLVHLAREQDRSAWYFPAIIPFYHDEVFLKTWGECLTLAQGSSDEISSRLSILWDSFLWEKGPDTSRWSLLFLAMHKTTPESSQWGFLGNLLNFNDLPR